MEQFTKMDCTSELSLSPSLQNPSFHRSVASVSSSQLKLSIYSTRLAGSYHINQTCLYVVDIRPLCPFRHGPAWPVFCEEFLGPSHFRPVKV